MRNFNKKVKQMSDTELFKRLKQQDYYIIKTDANHKKPKTSQEKKRLKEAHNMKDTKYRALNAEIVKRQSAKRDDKITKDSRSYKASLLAHMRLSKKHRQDKSKNGWIKNDYHTIAADKTRKLGRKLTSSEKKQIYKSAENYWINV